MKNEVNNAEIDNTEELESENKEQQEVSLEETVALLENKLKESEDKYLRILADTENAKRRFEKAQQDTANYAISDFARELIFVLDIFDKAFLGINKEEIQDSVFKNFLFGIELTQKELNKIMAKFNVNKIECLGQKFNPNYHESLYAKEDETKENDTIIEVIEEGYTISDRLLRSAKVGIVKNK